MKTSRLLSPGFWYYLAILLLMYLPILLLILFSFNDSTLLLFPLKGFTLRWYQELVSNTELLKSLRNSLMVGLVASTLSTLIGSMAAVALARFSFRGRDFFLTLASFPLVIPYVVLGVAMLLLFNAIGIKLSLATVVAGHIIINIPYTMLIVAARLAGFEANLEEASMDLGATYWGTLMRVTLPISMPAVVAAFLSAFTTSFDEFALSFFLTGTENTLPIYLYSQLRFPSRLPIVVALAAILMVVSVVLVVFSEWLRRWGVPSNDRGFV